MANTRALGSAFRRLIARILRRRPRIERKQSIAVGAYRRADGYDYITPTPAGALPMGKRRAR